MAQTPSNHVLRAWKLMDKLDREDDDYERALLRDELQEMADGDPEVALEVRDYGIPVD